MVNCELCGKEDNLVLAYIESVKFRVCSNCQKFGNIIQEEVVKNFEKRIFRKEEFIDYVIDDCGVLVKNSREYKGLSQHDIALAINEKASLIAKIEQGNINPGIELAKKLEKFLGLKLIMKEKVLEAPTKIDLKGSLTIGDFMKK